MRNSLKHLVAAGLAVAVLGAGMTAGTAFADPVKDRKAAMKDISKANKVIGAYAKGGGDLASAVAAAKQIAAVGEKLPGLFPKGSGEGYGKTTRAKPAIWSDWDKFQSSAKALVVAANNFTSWSQMADASTMKSAAGAVGKSCGGCHKVFRGPKPKKGM
jgi:cytochrome c556